jgi:peptide/nickel transport system permease protein
VSASAGDLLREPTLVEAPGTDTDRAVARSPLQLFWRRLRRDRVAMAALAFIGFICFVAIFAPVIRAVVGAPRPNVQNPDLLDDFGLPSGPSSEHWCGVDQRGRDVFSRTIYGARVSLQVAFISTFVIIVVGVTFGLIAGYYRGIVDSLLTRAMDVVLAFPYLILAVGIGVACAGADGCLGGLIQPGITTVIVVICLVSWPYMARIVRGQVLSIREKEFVEAARSLGASDRRIIFREILPNLIAPIIVYGTVLVPQVILFEAALSFLGIGMLEPTPDFGRTIFRSLNYLQTDPAYVFFPGVTIFVLVLAFNLFGDAVRDALDPKSIR